MNLLEMEEPLMMTRRNFIKAVGAAAVVATVPAGLAMTDDAAQGGAEEETNMAHANIMYIWRWSYDDGIVSDG